MPYSVPRTVRHLGYTINLTLLTGLQKGIIVLTVQQGREAQGSQGQGSVGGSITKPHSERTQLLLTPEDTL